MTQPADDGFMGGGFKTFPFDKEGDAVLGTVIEPPVKEQQRDMTSGEPKTWGDGKPQWMFRVTIQTELRDPEDPYDDGVRTLYLTWKRLDAVRAAIRAAGAQNIEVGGQIWLRFDSFGPRTKPGFNPPKVGWTAKYKPPVKSADADFMDQPRTPAAEPAFAGPSATSENAGTTPAAPASSPVLDSMRRLAESQQAAVDRLKGGTQTDDSPPF